MDAIRERIYKGRDGWQAETRFALGKTPEGKDRILDVSTWKRSRGLQSLATVAIADEGGFITMDLFGDYRKNIIESPSVRCTEKTVRMQHAEALAKIGDVHADAVTFYQMKDGAKAIAARRDAELAEQDKAYRMTEHPQSESPEAAH